MTDMLDAMMSQVLAEFSVISEQRARSYDGIMVDGGERDRAPAPLIEKPLVDYFRDRYNSTSSLPIRRKIVSEAIDALRLARRSPLPVGMEPEYGSPQWKRYIAECSDDTGALATRFHVTRRYINMIRAQYRNSE